MLEIAGTKLYDLKEVCEMFDANIQTVRQWIKSGKLPAKKIGRAYYCSEEDLKKFIAH